MNSKVEIPGKTSFDWLKWLLAIMLIIAGLVANYYYNTQPWPLRALGGLVLAIIVIAVSLQTQQGKNFLEFARESRMELRKVFWPTRQETIQTTLVVAV